MRVRAGMLARAAAACSSWRMSKQPMPGHLIAVIVLLGNYSYIATAMLCLLMAALAGPLMLVLPYLFATPLFAALAWLALGLCLREAWAPRVARIVAAVICGLGGLAVVLSSPDLEAGLVLGFAGVAHLGVGLYLLWALGRGDVRAWLAGGPAGASAPH
mgnify:CR=1 FL=1